MPSSFVVSQLRRTTIQLLLVNAVVSAIAVFVAVGMAGRAASLLEGPRPIDARTLLATVDPSALRHDFVTVRGENLGAVADYGEGEGEARRVSATFVALGVADRVLVVKTPPDEASGATYTGHVVELPGDLRDNLLESWRRERPGEPSPVLPIMLDAQRGAGATWIPLGLAAGVLLLGLRNLAAGIGRLRDHTRHPSWKKLAVFGSAAANAAAIDAEASNPAGVVTARNATLTGSWLINRGPFAVDMIPLAQVVWYFKHVTKHYTNFIPTGKTYALKVHDQRGKVYDVPGREKHVDLLIEQIHARAPWAIGGWAPDIAAAMAGPQRAEVAREVENRRRATAGRTAA